MSPTANRCRTEAAKPSRSKEPNHKDHLSRETTMSDRLTCPVCGSTTFQQDRTTSYDENVRFSSSLNGEIEDERIEDQEHNGEESTGAYRCAECDWELVKGDGTPITEPDEIVAKFHQDRRTQHAPTHIREAFQEFIEGDTDTVDVDGVEVGLGCFVEKLTDCTDILPAGYCSDLDLPQGSTYRDALQHLAKEAGK